MKFLSHVTGRKLADSVRVVAEEVFRSKEEETTGGCGNFTVKSFTNCTVFTATCCKDDHVENDERGETFVRRGRGEKFVHIFGRKTYMQITLLRPRCR